MEVLVVQHPLLHLRELRLPTHEQPRDAAQADRGVVLGVHLGVDDHPARASGGRNSEILIQSK